MNLKCLQAACLALFFSVSPAYAAAISSPDVYRLGNGLSVLVSADSRFPLVSVRLFVKAGSAWERPEEAGLSHMLEHMVFKGSATSGGGVDRKVENAGGSMNAYTSYDMTTYLTDLPSARWKEAMEAVRDLAFDPLLRQEDLDAEREVVIAEKRQRADSPMTRLFQMSMASALRGTPYETPVIGTEKALRGLTPGMMRDYIMRRYDPRDMVLSVAGDVDAGKVVEEAGRLFGGYANRNVLAPVRRIDPAALSDGLRTDVRPGPWKKAFLSLSFPMAGVGHELSAAADVLAYLLAGDDTCLLPKRFRIEHAAVDDIGASAMSFERAGILMVNAQLDAAGAEDFLAGLSGVLASLKADDFSDEQIRRAVLNLEDSCYRGREKIADIAETAGREFFYDPASAGGARWLAELRGVTRADIQAVMDAWVRRDALNVCALVPDAGKGSAPALTSERARRAVDSAWPGRPAEAADAGSVRTAAGQEVVDLGEGRRVVLTVDRSLPYVSASLVFSGGEALVPDDMEGLGSVAAGVLSSAAGSRDFAAMNVYTAERASGLAAACSTSSFSVKVDAPRRFAGDMLSLLRDVVDAPRFDASDIERVKREHLAAIALKEESPTGVMSRELRRFLFASGPLAHRGEGDGGAIAAFSAQDLRRFWEGQRKRPWVLSVAGDLDRDQVMAFASGLPVPEVKASDPPEAPWAGSRTLEKRLPGRDQAVYLMVFPTVGTDHGDRQALRLLSECLGGFTGKLYRKVREERSLGYTVFPLDWADRKGGFLGFGVIAEPGNLEKAKEAFEEVVRELQQEDLPAETIARAKAVAEVDYHRARQGRAVRAAEAAQNVLNGRPLDFGTRKLEEMKAVGAGELRKAAAKYLLPGKAYELTVRP